MQYIFVLLLVLIGNGSFAQDLSPIEKAYNQKVDEMLSRIFSGEIDALIDLAPFLSDEEEFTRVRRNRTSKVTTLRNVALGLIYYNCYFKDLSVSDTLTEADLKQFVKDNYPEKDKIDREVLLNFMVA